MGGLDTLSELEKIEVDNKDRPIEEILLHKAQVFVDPYQEADEQLLKERSDEIEKQQKLVLAEQKRKQKAVPLKIYRQGIGKYLNTTTTVEASATTVSANPATKKKKQEGFGNFSSW